MLGPFREARLSSEYQVGGCLGLQHYPGVDSAPRHGNTLLGYTVQKADTKSGVRLAGMEGGRNSTFWNGALVAPRSRLGRSELPKQGFHSGHLPGPHSCGSRRWSAITAPAAQSPTSLSATPMHFESLLRTSVGSARQPLSLLTWPTSREQVRHRDSELGRVKEKELKRDGALRHYSKALLGPLSYCLQDRGVCPVRFLRSPEVQPASGRLHYSHWL